MTAAAVKTFTVTRTPRYEGYEDLHGNARLAPDEFLILIDGAEIGGTYWCSRNPAVSGWGWNDGGLPGESWTSWGPRGLSCGHPSREAAEQAQVREYATDPDGHDRQAAMARAEQQAEAVQRQAERDAEDERREAERRRERLGDDEPGPTLWTLPAYHALYADENEVRAVADWLEANGIEDVDGRHEVRVEQRASRRAVVFEAPVWVWNGRSSTTTETRVVTVVTDPPAITAPDRPDLREVFAEHWPARFPLIDFGRGIACAKCTGDVKATVDEQMVLWPCPVVEKAISNDPRLTPDNEVQS